MSVAPSMPQVAVRKAMRATILLQFYEFRATSALRCSAALDQTK
jgi:hypothetical protein